MTTTAESAERPSGMWREAAVLAALAIVFGFAYTVTTGRGFFAAAGPLQAPGAKLPLVTAEAARSAQEAGTALFVDSRHAFDYGNGHIPHAMSLPLNEFDSYRVQFDGIPRTQRIIVYCDAAECNSSTEVARRLAQLGFTDVSVFFGGWKEWRTLGLPIEGAAQ